VTVERPYSALSPVDARAHLKRIIEVMRWVTIVPVVIVGIGVKNATDSPSPIIGIIIIGFGVLIPLAFVFPQVRRLAFSPADWTVDFTDGRVITPDGEFNAGCLRSLHLTSEGASPERQLLAFSGVAVHNALLVGPPGLPTDQAEELMAEVRARIDGAADDPAPDPPRTGSL
jgi:hypothetical protein